MSWNSAWVGIPFLIRVGIECQSEFRVLWEFCACKNCAGSSDLCEKSMENNRKSANLHPPHLNVASDPE